MNWTNPGLVKAKNYDAEHFTTDSGIRIRRFLHPLIHMVIRIAVDRPVDIIRYPNLPKGRNYIFAAGHSFPGEIASNLSVIDDNLDAIRREKKWCYMIDTGMEDAMIDFRQIIHPLVVLLTKSRVPHQVILQNPYHIDNHQPVIYAVNHSNSNDIPIICRAVQRHCWVLIGKQRLFLSDRLFFFLNGAIWVDRKDKQDMQLAKDRIQEHLLTGKSLIWFPEGTWNLTDHLLMLPMKWGIINIAKKCQVPIIPIVLEYDSLQKQCAVHFGEPFIADDFSLQDGITALRDKMAALRWEAWEHKGVFSRQELNLEMERTKLYQAVTDYPPLDWDYEQSIIFDPRKHEYE